MFGKTAVRKCVLHDYNTGRCKQDCVEWEIWVTHTNEALALFEEICMRCTINSNLNQSTYLITLNVFFEFSRTVPMDNTFT